MTDILGPADAGAARTVTTTTDVSSPAAGDSWFADCVAGVAGTGTPIVARWLNRLLQQERRLVRNSGVAESNADDDMLSKAVQSGALNWAGLFGGSANALTATLAPTPVTLPPGTVISGVIASANTGAVTLNVDGIGAQAVVMTDGVALSGGELQPGLAEFVAYSGGFYVRSTVSFDRLHSQLVVSDALPATGSYPFIWYHFGTDTVTTPTGVFGPVVVEPGMFAFWNGNAWQPFTNIASASLRGEVIVGSGIAVAGDGTISVSAASLPPSVMPARNTLLARTTAGSGTVTVPAGVTWLYYEGGGAGGGGGPGGGSGFSNCSGGGGGSGGGFRGWLAVTPGQVIAYTVGAGGAGASVNGTPGGTGGTTTFGGASATGGGGGILTLGGSTNTASGGVYGQGSGGQFNFPGGSGGDGNPFTALIQGGAGASSALGGGGRTATEGLPTRGDVVNGVAPGSGGGGIWGAGTSGHQQGGNGADGYLFLTY